jgi:hypothetical protein
MAFELAIACAPGAPARDEGAIHLELLDAECAQVAYVDVAIAAGGDAVGIAELAVRDVSPGGHGR